MFAPGVFADRRRRLIAEVGGPILLAGNGERARNLPMTSLPFRQDSSFLYYTGCSVPGAALLLTNDGETLFLPPVEPDDALWHGPTPTLAEQGHTLGFESVEPSTHLAVRARALTAAKTLAVADEDRNRALSAWTGMELRFGRHFGSADLVDAVIRHRRPKTPAEIEQMQAAADLSARAHLAVMRACRPGASERALAALFEAVLAAGGGTPGYGTILTVRGEVLHNHDHSGVLRAGQLLLLDGGGEVASGYGADITRVTPVGGRFDARQRSAYDAVLAANEASIALCRPGVRYREVHDASSRILARWLVDEGLLRGDPDALADDGAHALFFPHGVGHHLGMDVHDLENFGDLPSYPPDRKRPDQFGTRNLRLDLPLEAGWVVTIEPGFYVVPAILGDRALTDRFAGRLDLERARSWIGFGGIRIEDDIHVTPTGPQNLTWRTPKDPAAVEALAGTGPSAEERLC